MSTYHGLYYPYIHFTSDGWLKTSALYWEGMNRIVPGGIRPDDSDSVKSLVDAGFVASRDPTGAAFEIATPFSELLKRRHVALQRKFRLSESRLEIALRKLGLRSPRQRQSLSIISSAKFDAQLLGDLKALDLVSVITREDGYDWIGMHPTLARVYMTALAETLAPQIGARPVAESAFDHVAISGVTLERLTDALLSEKRSKPEKPDRSQEVEETIATIAFRSVVPAKPELIPTSQVIEFRKAYAEERALFQLEITKIIKDCEHLGQITDEAKLQQHLENTYKTRLAGKLERMEQAMRRTRWDVVDGTIAASWAVPTAVVTGLAALGLALPAVSVAAIGIAFGGWQIWRKREKSVAEIMKPSPEAYLYRAKRLLSPREALDDIRSQRSGFFPMF
jgi:hypothetical protein